MKLEIEEKNKELLSFEILEKDNNETFLNFLIGKKYNISHSCHFGECGKCIFENDKNNGKLLKFSKNDFPLEKNEKLACLSKIKFLKDKIIKIKVK